MSGSTTLHRLVSLVSDADNKGVVGTCGPAEGNAAVVGAVADAS